MDNMMRRMAMTVLAVVCAFLLAGPVAADEGSAGDWPKGIRSNGNKVVMYQPQPEKLVEDRLELRAAVSVETDSDEAPVFGAVWLNARLHKTPDSQEAKLTDIVVTNVRFPSLKEEDGKMLKDLLEREVPQWALQFNLEQLHATLEMEEKRAVAAKKISTSPPKILFVSAPAVLVVIDGEPRLKNIENSSLMRVVNTPFTLLFSPSEKKYYLYADTDTWYVSQNIYDNWRVTRQVPDEVAGMAPKEDNSRQESQGREIAARKGPPPEIIVSTEPAELISSDGEPEYTPIRETDLLYMSNTESEVLLHIMDRQYYVLLAGRWYRSASIRGHWTYVAGSDLPPDFARIPEGSHMASVLYAVPGTHAAREAVLDAYVPTTAAVDPNSASLTIEYDGKPEFESIKGTNLYYAVNTAIPVIWAGKWYYACDRGIWFVAPNPKGPWRVATSIPNSIYFIPPDSPVYHVTFVRVYDAAPDVVYVGYTPGYTHTYVYDNTIVYGTGYYWPGWYGTYYYPRPSTWGFHANWDPWYGWGYGLSYSTGSFRFSIGLGDWYRGSWWGPYYWWDDYPYYGGYWGRPHYDRHSPRYRGDGYYGHRNLYWSKRNKARVIGIPAAPGTRPGISKGITRKGRGYYEDRPSRQPRNTYPDRPAGPKEKWLQHEGGKLPSPYEPNRRAPKERSQPREQYNRNWGTQQVDPHIPSRTPNTGRPEPGRVPDFHGTMAPKGSGGGRHR